MQIAVLSSSNSWYFQDLFRAARGQHDVFAVSYRQLSSQIGQHASTVCAAETKLNNVPVVLVRSMPPGSLEQVVFRMDALAHLEAAGVHVINSPRAIEAAVDKYLATCRLQAAGLPVPETVACQTTEQGLIAYEQLGGDVVVKPLFGGEGRGIVRVCTPELAYRVFRSLEQIQAVLYLQRFIPHEGCDYRLLVLGSKIIGMRRHNRLDWRTNVSRGAEAEAFEPPSDWSELAFRAADAIGASVAGVDLLRGNEGQVYVLEVNAVPGWRALAKATSIDVAREVLEFCVAGVRRTGLARPG